MEVSDSQIVNGKGLILKKSVKKGEIIFSLTGTIFNYPTRETIHIGNNLHIYDEFGIYINHSFQPTVHIDGKNVIALMDLNNGDEIMFNYNDSEIKMANTFYVGEQLVCGKKQE